MKEHGNRAYLHVIQCPVTLEKKACLEASSFKMFKNVLQTALKEQAIDVPFYSYQKTVIF